MYYDVLIYVLHLTICCRNLLQSCMNCTITQHKKESNLFAIKRFISLFLKGNIYLY